MSRKERCKITECSDIFGLFIHALDKKEIAFICMINIKFYKYSDIDLTSYHDTVFKTIDAEVNAPGMT